MLACIMIRPAHAQSTTAGQQDQIIAPGTTPQLVDSSFRFTEGPAVDRRGNVFFTDQPNNKIWEYDLQGKLRVFMSPTGRSNGMYFDHHGNLISCADEHNQLWSIGPDKKITVLIRNYRGHQLNGPNDLWIAPSGDIYFTDPYYQRDYWTRTKPDSALGGQYVYLFRPGKNELIRVDDKSITPNGIVGTPDGKHLYVADLGLGKTFRYDIASDGSLKNKTLFAGEGSDGMTIDNKGNIYLTGKGVDVYNPAGEKILHIDIPEEWTGNICFAGKQKNILFITASKSVYVLPTLVHGVE